VETSVAAYLFAKSVLRLKRSSGILFTALFLKQCAVSLQRYYGMELPLPKECTKPMVSLSRDGLPRIIPSFHRRVIKMKDDQSDRLVKMYLSWFSLGRCVTVMKRVTSDTFTPITKFNDHLPGVLEVCSEVEKKDILEHSYLSTFSLSVICLFIRACHGLPPGSHYRIHWP